MSQKIKILYLIGQLGLGGSERQLYLLLKHFDLTRFDVSVVVFNPSPNLVLNDALEALGVKVWQVPQSTRTIPARVWYLYRLFRQLRPHLIHSWTLHDNVYAGLVGKLAGIPVRWGSVRDSLCAKSFLLLPRFFQYLSLHSVRVLVVNSCSIKEELVAQGIPQKRIMVLENCVLAQTMDKPPVDLSEYGIQNTDRMVGIVGNLRIKKNHFMFIEGVSKVLPDFDHVFGVMVGQPISGEAELPGKISARISELRMEQRIIPLGFRADVLDLMHHFSVFCLTSNYEGTPNVVLEAMAAACPVVATRVGGVPALIQDGVNGFLVEPGDVDGLAIAVRTLLSSPELAARMGQAGREMVQQKYGCERAVAHLTGQYLQALSGAGSRSPTVEISPKGS